MSYHTWWGCVVVAALAVSASGTRLDSRPLARPAPNSADEPLAKTWSAERSAEFLDGAAMAWLDKHNCAACHTSYLYLMAGPALSKKPTPGLVRMREFLTNRVAHWDDDDPAAKPDPGSEGVTEVVATAATLAFHDAQTTGKLHALTRKALDRMWTIQRGDGSWDWNKHRLPPLEHDDYFGAAFAALGVGMAPEDYARTDKAQAGLARLRKYFKDHPAPDLHHRTWLLWAALKVDGLMSAEERQRTVKDLLALQRDDGGWSLPAFADWKGNHGKPNDKTRPSDGYATGLTVYVLRQTGMATDNEAIQRGVKWLKANQRDSGRWFTYSLNSDKTHYITNAGTSFAVLALKACE